MKNETAYIQQAGALDYEKITDYILTVRVQVLLIHFCVYFKNSYFKKKINDQLIVAEQIRDGRCDQS